MIDRRFKTVVGGLKEGESTPYYAAVVRQTASKNELEELFEVCVWRRPKKQGGEYKFQWTKWKSNGKKPELPSLKPEIVLKLKRAFNRQDEKYMTSGIYVSGGSGDGMADPDTVFHAIELFHNEGIDIMTNRIVAQP